VTVPWKPQFPTFAPGPAPAFDFSVAERLAADDVPVGHLLVFAEPYARASGHLWWKTLSDPYLTLEVLSSINGEFADSFFSSSEDVDGAVAFLQRGQWQPVAQQHSATYVLRWLDAGQSCRVSAEAFGLDLAAERRRRKRPD
jgi:hypothetical protein